jgi:hypothetical protein
MTLRIMAVLLCLVSFILNVTYRPFMLNDTLNAIMLSVVMLSVMEPTSLALMVVEL